MITNLEKFDLLLGNKRPNNKNYIYAQIIRNERIRRKFTLQEIARGICSVSYLCKFEKNVIVVDKEYIKAIFERVNLDYTKVGLNIIEDGVFYVIKAYLYDRFDEIRKYFEMIDDSLFNVQNYLIKGFYYLVNKMDDEFKEVIKTIDNIKETLQMEDLGPFMFLVIQYYINQNQFVEAEKYLHHLNRLTFDEKEINWLIYEQQFIVGYNTNNYPMAFKYYNKLISNLNIGFPNHRQLRLKLMMLGLNAKSYLEEIKSEISNVTNDYLDKQFSLDVTYWKLVVYLKENSWFDVVDDIVDNKLFVEARFAALHLYTAYQIDDENYINEAVSYSKDLIFTDGDLADLKFIKFMLMKFANEPKASLVDYLKQEILSNETAYNHHLYKEVYDKFYLDFLCSTSKYKEAFYFLNNKKSGPKVK
jgi:transcriptional regulator with XRE-family HTH domain